MSESTEKPNPNLQSVRFRFERGKYYRTVHADGAWGRNDGYGNIHLTFFNEKPPMPASGVLELNSKTGQWTMNTQKLDVPPDTQLIRELEVDVTMSLPAAIAVRDTLNGFINAVFANLEAQQKSRAQENPT